MSSSTHQPSVRLLAPRFSLPMDNAMLRQIVETLPVEHCTSICSERFALPSLAEGEHVWISSRIAKWGQFEVPQDTKWPVDEALLESLRPYEAVFMDMVERLEEHRDLSYDERKRMYLRQLQFWHHHLQTHRINLYLSTGIPHECHEYILYGLCKKYDIPTIFCYSGPLQHTTFFLEDWEDSSLDLRAAYKQLQERYAQQEEIDVTFSEKFAQYYQVQTATDRDPPPPWDMWTDLQHPIIVWRRMVWQMLWQRPGAFVRHALSFVWRYLRLRGWVTSYQRWRRAAAARSMFQFYDQQAREPDLTQPYVYVPLHVRPESSTCPMAGVYDDQLLVVQQLAAALPAEVQLYVKEHPMQEELYPNGRGRNLTFYEDLLQIPTVQFVPRNFNSFRLTENAVAIATGTGSVGFEALFREKPVFMFGHGPYQYATGVFSIHTAADCQSAVQAVLNEGEKPTLRDSTLFLKAIEETVVPGVFERDFQPSAGVTKEENLRCMVSAYLERIHRYYPATQPR